MEHDEATVLMAIQGNREALQHLLKLEKEKLYRMAFTYLRNEEEALEIFQQTVLLAIESIHQLKEPKYLSTWLTKICINQALLVVRKKKKLVVMDEIEERRMESGILDEVAHQVDLAQALSLLPEKYKTPLVLRYYQDFTVKQIADFLQCPEGTVKTMIHRGLGMLKKSMKGVYKDERKRDFN